MPRKNRSYRKKGGGNYTSAATYANYVNGNENEQFNRTMSDSSQSNLIIGAQGQNANQVSTPSPQQLSLIQSAGRRNKHYRSRSHSRRRRGGLWGTVINQGAVPLAILGMQQNYRKKNSKTNKHRNNYKHKYRNNTYRRR
jgi:hypothetical protein